MAASAAAAKWHRGGGIISLAAAWQLNGIGGISAAQHQRHRRRHRARRRGARHHRASLVSAAAARVIMLSARGSAQWRGLSGSA